MNEPQLGEVSVSAAQSRPTSPTRAKSAQEQQYLDDLAELARVQKQITSLRNMIPSILNPILAPARAYRAHQQQQQQQQQVSSLMYSRDHDQPNADHGDLTRHHRATPIDDQALAAQRDEMFGRVAKAARCGIKDITDLKTRWSSDTVQDILNRTKASAAADGDLEPGRSIPDLD